MLMAGVLLLDGHGDRCRENPEMAGNLAAVREMLGNDQKFGKWPRGGESFQRVLSIAYLKFVATSL